jgi:hypothetical protein
VAARICPHCLTEIPAPNAAAYSDNIECPKCKARLEVASGTRLLSSFVGLLAALMAWWLSQGSSGALAGGVLPVLYAVLAFGIISPLVLMFTANLRNAPVAPATVEPALSSVGHGGGHQ